MGARVWLGWLGASIMIASIASIAWSQTRLGEYASLQGAMSSYELEIVSDASVSAYGASLTACVIDGDGDAVAVSFFICGRVHEAELKTYRGIKIT